MVLLADDLGWAGVSFHDDQFATPNIDALAAAGMKLDRFYVAPMCSPTRAGLMTGRYPIRFGLARAVIPPQRDFGLPTEELTMGEAMTQLGYTHRGVFGKWHLGHRRSQWHPLRQGFTHFHGHYNGAIDYFELTREGQRDWHVDWTPSEETGYATRLIGDAAATWIGDAAAEDSPYLCYVPFNAPHSPFQAPQESIDKFDQLRIDKKRTLAAMIWEMDLAIGKILAAIERTGEADNTIVWFFSDNGGVGGIPGNNRPLRGSKLTVYEGGIRVPACVRWPAEIRPGTQTDTVAGYIDVLPTLLDAAGGDAASIAFHPLDGVSLLPVLTGSDDAPAMQKEAMQKLKHRDWFSYHGQQGPDQEHLAVTSGGWKLKVNGPRLEKLSQLTDGTNEVELFHLSEDLLEQSDLRQARPDRVQTLGRKLIDHRSLQPADSVPPYSVGAAGFTPPTDWRLDP